MTERFPDDARIDRRGDPNTVATGGSSAETNVESILASLNPQQRAAARHGMEPLLIVAGAGTGKTATLVHRVAWLIAQGVDPARILLLTFTRRAAGEMLRRVESILAQLKVGPAPPAASAALDADSAPQAASESNGLAATDAEATATDRRGGANSAAARVSTRIWGGTFHAVAHRLLRRYSKAIGLSPEFSLLDQGDAEDLMAAVRAPVAKTKAGYRFPNKSTCLAIYSRCVNAREKLERVLVETFPWCEDWRQELGPLFDAYVDRKQRAALLDYDDLLLYWHALLEDPQAAASIRGLFDCVLVDEYQDTNVLQAEIIYGLAPEGRGLTAVGDDAQSIYAFRAATVRNILDFPKRYPRAQVLPLEQNYRSTQPILEATNRVLALARERYEKNLWSQRREGEKPAVVACFDESDQVDYLIEQILARREEGIDLRRQAVLFRASHHSMSLEAELARRGIPFQKFGGLKFLEAAHIKDMLAFLRLAENWRDEVAAARVLPLLPGIGASRTHDLIELLNDSAGVWQAWRTWKPPKAAEEMWPRFVDLLQWLTAARIALAAQIERVRNFYRPLAEGRYDNLPARMRDLEQLEVIASRFGSRRRMLVELTLDPPRSTQDFAGPPLLDDDYLVLSTMHSAKGLEWDAVYVIHAADGNIPSDMATRNPEQIEEERRLFYVAMTRAKSWLTVCHPLRYYHYAGFGDAHGYAQRTRFLPQSVMPWFDQQTSRRAGGEATEEADIRFEVRSDDIRRRNRRLWS